MTERRYASVVVFEEPVAPIEERSGEEEYDSDYLDLLDESTIDEAKTWEILEQADFDKAQLLRTGAIPLGTTK